MPESRGFFSYSARSAALTWPNMGAAALAVVTAAAGAFGFAAFLAKAPEVETARIARPTRMIFFMFSSHDERVSLSIISIPQNSSMRPKGRQVRATKSELFDHLVGEAEQGGLDREPKLLRGLE